MSQIARSAVDISAINRSCRPALLDDDVTIDAILDVGAVVDVVVQKVKKQIAPEAFEDSLRRPR